MSLVIEGIREAIEFVEELSETVLVGSALEVGSRLAEETPVHTGFAKNSWLVTNSPDDPGEPGENSINTQKLRGFEIGDTIYINNGCDYIKPLNDGHSRKAPAGMTVKVMPEVKSIINGQIADAERSGR